MGTFPAYKPKHKQLTIILLATYQVILFRNLQKYSPAASVVGHDGLHFLLASQSYAANHSQLTIKHFDHFVFLQLDVDK